MTMATNGQQILAVSDQVVYFGTSVNDIFKACVQNSEVRIRCRC